MRFENSVLARFALMCWMMVFTSTSVTGIVKVYKAPPGVVLSTLYSVRIKAKGASEWLPVEVMSAQVWKRVGANLSNTYPFTAFTGFDCEGQVEVKVRWKGSEPIQSVKIRPESKNIKYRIIGNEIVLLMDEPAKLSVEINGDRYQNLQLFANPIECEIPDKTDDRILFIPSGTLHTGDIHLKSGQTLYIEGGAAVKGCVYLDTTVNARVMGRGIIYQPSYDAISVRNARNVIVEGITAVNYGIGNGGGCALRCGESSDVTIRNYKVFGRNRWGDGIDIMSSSRVIIDDVYIRSSDDAIAVYATRGEFQGGCTDVKVLNSVLAPDIAHPINIGTHGDIKGTGDTIQHLIFKNIDILQHNEYQSDYQGTMAISCGDNNTIRNILFDDIRVEDFLLGQLLNISVVKLGKYNLTPGRKVENIWFNSIDYKGTTAIASEIKGYSECRTVRNIQFSNLRIAGNRISSLGDGNIQVGEHTAEIYIHPPAGKCDLINFQEHQTRYSTEFTNLNEFLKHFDP